MSKEFKPGDRVLYQHNGDTDKGTITRKHPEQAGRWYARWDLDGAEQHASEDTLFLLSEEEKEEEAEDELLRKAAILCIERQDYARAEEILMILRK